MLCADLDRSGHLDRVLEIVVWKGQRLLDGGLIKNGRPFRR